MVEEITTDEISLKKRRLDTERESSQDQDHDMVPLVFNEIKVCHDPLVMMMCDFLQSKCTANVSNIEIEAKFGMIIDKTTKTRLWLPVLTESILSPEYKNFRFESNMPPEKHQFFNKILNQKVELSGSPGFTGVPLKYKRRNEVDEFYPEHHGNKIRASYDTHSGQKTLIGIIEKERIADMTLCIPQSPFDVRLSINNEKKVTKLPPGNPINIRHKNRISYLFGNLFQIDLTQVCQNENTSIENKTHELELEWTNSKLLVDEMANTLKKESNVFETMSRILLFNIRQICYIAKNCPK